MKYILILILLTGCFKIGQEEMVDLGPCSPLEETIVSSPYDCLEIKLTPNHIPMFKNNCDEQIFYTEMECYKQVYYEDGRRPESSLLPMNETELISNEYTDFRISLGPIGNTNPNIGYPFGIRPVCRPNYQFWDDEKKIVSLKLRRGEEITELKFKPRICGAQAKYIEKYGKDKLDLGPCVPHEEGLVEGPFDCVKLEPDGLISQCEETIYYTDLDCSEQFQKADPYGSGRWGVKVLPEHEVTLSKEVPTKMAITSGDITHYHGTINFAGGLWLFCRPNYQFWDDENKLVNIKLRRGKETKVMKYRPSRCGDFLKDFK